MRESHGMWVGWPGDSSPEDPAGQRRLLADWVGRHGYVSVELPAELSRAFYEGYANDTLWPLLHGFPTRVVFDPESWVAYRDANRRFAETVVARHLPNDLVWVHDYQLLLVPELVRDARPDARVGFFLHVPFPSSEVFGILPQRDQILRGLLGADMIAFQTHSHLHNFRRALLLWLGLDSRMDRVEVGDRVVRLHALPIGVVPDEWTTLIHDDPAVGRRIRQLRTRHGSRQLILSVDRLDYTKGIPERLRAYRRLLRASPERRGRITLIQVAVPTREHVPAYQELRREVSELVGEIVGEFATPEWAPVVYLRRSVPRGELAALYAAADVAWVSPLRDGMNLVAKEYLTCQEERPGVLVISEFAGAAQEMAEAIRVNPYDEEGSVDALARALDMPEEERRERMLALHARVLRGDARTWAATFLEALREAAGERATDRSSEVRPLPVAELHSAFVAAHRRLVCVDYDGTLVPIVARPRDAVPTEGLADILRCLARSSGTTVLLVSGRRAQDLDRWFGHVDGLWLAAEHGALLRGPADGDWSPLHQGADSGWKGQVRPVLEHFVARTPGSLIEEKTFSLAWHYRQADPEFGEWLAKELADTLHALVAGTDLAILLGDKVVEVRFAWAQKGEALARLMSRIEVPDFTLAIGDDRTDEDLFERLAARDWSVKVGPGPTRARFRISRPTEVRALLAMLPEGAEPDPS
jgi:trehalose 6-phosphate synthase/phosphatase